MQIILLFLIFLIQSVLAAWPPNLVGKCPGVQAGGTSKGRYPDDCMRYCDEYKESCTGFYFRATSPTGLGNCNYLSSLSAPLQTTTFAFDGGKDLHTSWRGGKCPLVSTGIPLFPLVLTYYRQ